MVSENEFYDDMFQGFTDLSKNPTNHEIWKTTQIAN
jgi:hypothetical protein